MKLIMTGGGDSEHFHEIDAKFIGMLGESPILLYIPLATDPADWEYGLERIQSVFSTIKFSDIKMCTDLASLDWNYLKEFAAIYFDGGNTFNLMSYIRETHTYELLHRFLHNGGVINGDSAGAIILGSHLETAHMGDAGDDNDSGIISYQGLNLLGSWAIHCHYEDSHDKELIEFSKTYGFPIIALSEQTAIFVNDSQLNVIGQASAVVILEDKKVVVIPGESYSLTPIQKPL